MRLPVVRVALQTGALEAACLGSYLGIVKSERTAVAHTIGKDHGLVWFTRLVLYHCGRLRLHLLVATPNFDVLQV
jgi:hypothetical protein